MALARRGRRFQGAPSRRGAARPPASPKTPAIGNRPGGAGRIEPFAVVGAGDFDRAEAFEMRRDELRVEQRSRRAAAARPERPGKFSTRRCGAMEHALPEKRPAQRKPVEAADQIAVAPGLDGMDEAEVEQFAKQLRDGAVYSGFLAAGAAFRAAREHGVEGLVDRISNFCARIVLARLFETIRPSSGKMPRSCGSNQ